jgi:hypothetical protein
MAARDGELTAQLKKTGSVILDASGNGTLYFDPDNANQRWEVTGIVVSTNQGMVTPYPVATVYVGPETSPGNSQGATASGNQDTFGSGCIDVGNADQLAIVWTGGVPGTRAFAQLSGTKYTRRT